MNKFGPQWAQRQFPPARDVFARPVVRTCRFLMVCGLPLISTQHEAAGDHVVEGLPLIGETGHDVTDEGGD
jgi:hypothetical protein